MESQTIGVSIVDRPEIGSAIRPRGSSIVEKLCEVFGGKPLPNKNEKMKEICTNYQISIKILLLL